MSTIQLIVTGELERLDLAESLRQVFPSAEFREALKLDSFTSAKPSLAGPPTRSLRSVDKLAKAMLAEVEPGGRHADPADLVVLIDDLELVNVAAPADVVDHFRNAMKQAIASRDWKSLASRTKAEARLPERCSFHLLKPMTEAYFFGEPSAIDRAGRTRPNLFAGGDVESFNVTDESYADVPERHRRWATADRSQHPKRYLDYLCTPLTDDLSAASEVQAYRETKNGGAALRTLDWAAVMRDPRQALFARSLFEDVAQGLGVANPFPGQCAPETRFGPKSLRNL